MTRECSWCGEDFEPTGKESKCDRCRSRKAYDKDYLHTHAHDMRMSRPAVKNNPMRSHGARP